MSTIKKEQPKPQSKPLLTMALAGCSSIVAQTCTHPIETIKARMQISSEAGRANKGNYGGIGSTFKAIVKNEGFGGLYKGIAAAYARELLYSSLRLGLYEPIKKLIGAEGSNVPLYKKFLSGSSAGLIAACAANPVDYLKIRMQNWEGESKSVIWHAKTVYSEAGIGGFYRGVQITVIRAMIINGTKLSTYDQIKNYFKKSGVKDGVKLQFVCSMTAGLIMASVSAPFDLCRTRVFSQDAKNPKYKGLVDCLVKTVKNEGPLGLYKGFVPMWGRMGPFTVIQLVTWEQLRRICGIKSL
jgi:solute carrier family 25 (mitochondrial carrier), member 14/30